MRTDNNATGEIIVSLSMIGGACLAFVEGVSEPIYSVAGALMLIAV